MLHRLLDIRIGTRLASAYGLVIALIIVMAGIAGLQVGKLARATAYYNSNIVPSIDLVRKVVVAVEDVRRFELEHVAAEDIAASTEAEEGIKESRGRVSQGLRDYEPLISDGEERQIFAKVKSTIGAYFANWERLRVASEGAAESEAKDKEAKRLFRESGKAFQAVHRSATEWGSHKETISSRYYENSVAVHRSALIWLVSFSIVAVVGGVVSAIVITRSITRPLEKALSVARTVASGDLTSHIEPQGRDEAAELLRALNEMNRRLVEVVSRVHQGSESVALGSSEIARGNADLSQRTESQASNLERTAASMKELAATVRSSEETAAQASQLARESALAARRGGASMIEAVATMEEISSSSHKIADIIAVIDGIAFQTNILALNAAVEAARAGEQGRGFAVVAGEVRALAQRSAEAAKDIKRLIVGSVAQVDKGMRTVGEAGASVSDIVGQVQRVSDMLGEISGAAREQTRSIGQVGQAVSRLEEVTQQNAALVEESAAAAESLRVQAQRLVEAVSVFKLDAKDAFRSPEQPPGEGAQAARKVLALRPSLALPSSPRPFRAS